jgi:alkylation response protein AidB-like acyl-CoA dehydrogenase
MDFELTEEQKILREAAARLMKREVTPYLDNIPTGQMLTKEEIKDILKKLNQLQYVGAILPEEFGGGGLDFISYALMMEELDYRIYGLVMTISAVANDVCNHANDALKSKVLPLLLSGNMIACFAVSETNAGSDMTALATKAVRDGESFCLNGTKTWITNGSFADAALVLAGEDTGGGLKKFSQFFVVADSSPFDAIPVKSIADGPLQIMGDLTFKNCHVPIENSLGEAGEGLNNTLSMLQSLRCMIALHAVNIAQKAIDAAIIYAQERVQFGKPIGQFQLIQSMIADGLPRF